MTQALVVDLAVAFAALYVAWKYLPKRWRDPLAQRLARVATDLRLPRSWVRRLERKVASAGGCGSCNSCNACATDPVATPTAALGTRRVVPIRRQ